MNPRRIRTHLPGGFLKLGDGVWSETSARGPCRGQPRCTPILMNLKDDRRLRGARGLGEVRQGRSCATRPARAAPDTELNVGFGGLEGATLSYRQLLEKEEREQYGITPAGVERLGTRGRIRRTCRADRGRALLRDSGIGHKAVDMAMKRQMLVRKYQRHPLLVRYLQYAHSCPPGRSRTSSRGTDRREVHDGRGRRSAGKSVSAGAARSTWTRSWSCVQASEPDNGEVKHVPAQTLEEAVRTCGCIEWLTW